MLGLELTTPVIARRRRSDSAPPPIFPGDAFGYWEGQGQSNMTGFNQISDVPANLRVVNPSIEMMTNDPGWRPYILLDEGESETVDGTLYQGKIDEIEIPPAAGGAGPLIGLHEAMIAGAMDDQSGLIPAGLLMGKFADAGKLLDEFLPDYDDGSAPLGGANFNARGVNLPTSLRARLALAPIFAQGKIWLQGEANAGAARAAADLGAPEIVNYAADFSRLRIFERAQLGAPALPYYLVAIAEADQYDVAINAALESLCRWRVDAGGTVTDLGAGRDATSYYVDHGIDTGGNIHFSMDQMRVIGGLVWAAHVHQAGNPFGLSKAHQITAIRPVHQRAPEVTAFSHDEISVDAVVNEDGVLYGLAQLSGAPAPDHAAIVAGGVSVAALRGRSADLSFLGLAAETGYDIHLAFTAASGDAAEVQTLSAVTDQEPPVAAGWTPADANPLIWFDAQDAATVTEDAGEVTGWTNKAPTGANLAPSGSGFRPALSPTGLNGFAALDFDGDDDLEATGVALAPDMCLLVVAEIDVPTNGSESLIDFQNTNLKVRANNSSQFRARFELQNGGGANINPSPTTNYAGAPHLFLGRYDAAADRIEVWIDGTEVGSADTYSTDILASDNLRLMRPFGSGLRLDGKVGEVVAIGSSAVADREQLEGYAAHRWGLTDLLPAGHPYKTTAP